MQTTFYSNLVFQYNFIHHYKGNCAIIAAQVFVSVPLNMSMSSPSRSTPGRLRKINSIHKFNQVPDDVVNH